ncbi:MAG: hypothetical protein GX421_04030 [Caldisericales bacterium]|nr:hypothetical protein [Caldisericales bacterium]
MRRIIFIVIITMLLTTSCMQIEGNDLFQDTLFITKNIDDIPSIYPLPHSSIVDPVAGIYVESTYPPVFNGSLKTQEDYRSVYMTLNRELKSIGWQIEVQSSFLNKEFDMAQITAFRDGLWLSVKIYSEYGQTKVTYQSQRRTK